MKQYNINDVLTERDFHRYIMNLQIDQQLERIIVRCNDYHEHYKIVELLPEIKLKYLGRIPVIE